LSKKEFSPIEELVTSQSKNNNPSNIAPENNVEEIKESGEDKMKNLEQYMYSSLKYINRFCQGKKKSIEDAELFINPITKQKVYVSEQGIFLLNCFEGLNPLISLEQIKKSNKVLFLVTIGAYKQW